MKLGRETTREKLKVGEVYAREGCFEIWCKLEGTESMLLAFDEEGTVKEGEIYEDYAFGCIMPIYKLSLKTQRFWRNY